MDNVRVEIAPDALSTIKADVVRAFKSIPRRGAETGGLLCGAIVESGSASLVRIDSVVPVPVEHRFGPAYRLSDVDKPNFQKAIQDWAQLGIIGWYRSQTRQGDAPDPQDRSVTGEFFPVRPSAFLICYPDATLNVSGNLCIWVEGKKEEFTRIELGRHSLLDEALRSAEAELAVPETTRIPEHKERPVQPVSVAAARVSVAAVAIKSPVPSPPPQPPPSPPPALQATISPPPQPAPQVTPPLTPQETTRNGRIALFLTLALAISFGAYLVHARLQPGSQSLAPIRPGVLGMHVERQGTSLLVSWNRQAPEILQASVAKFRIASGERSRTLALSPHELRTGSLLYTVSAEDIEMELNVSGPAGNFAESVRVVGAAPGEQPALTPIPPRLAMEPPARSEPAPIVPARKSEDLRVVVAPPPERRKAHRDFVRPPSVATENKPLATPPEAPEIRVAANLPPAVPVGIPGLPAQSLPQRSAAPNDTLSYVAPRSIRTVQPSVGATSPSMVRAFAQTDKPHSVQVEVSIDERGSVTNATVAHSTGPFAYLFVDAALAAARRWQFEPARRDGRPVQSKMILKFDFVKSTR
jgi:TonB family protein